MKHRHDRHHRIARCNVQTVRLVAANRMQHQRPMRILHAFRVPRGAGCVAQRGGCGFIQIGPAIGRVGLVDQFVIKQEPFDLRGGVLVPWPHQNVVLYGLQVFAQFGRDR